MLEKAGVLRIIISYFFCAVFLLISFFGVITQNNNISAQPEQHAYFASDELFSSKQENVTPKEEKPQE